MPNQDSHAMAHSGGNGRLPETPKWWETTLTVGATLGAVLLFAIMIYGAVR